MLVLAIDPGNPFGWCLWGEDGYVDSGQCSLDDGLVTLRALRPMTWAAIGIEKSVFGHKHFGAAMGGAMNRGRIHGWVEALSGLDVWEPLPATWRKATHGQTRVKDGVTVDEADMAHARAVSGRCPRQDEAAAICQAEATWHWHMGTTRRK